MRSRKGNVDACGFQSYAAVLQRAHALYHHSSSTRDWSARIFILSSVLRNAIAPTVLHHTLAILNVPATPSPDTQTEVLERYIDRYLQAGSLLEFPADAAAMTALRRLYSRISYFVDYCSRAMRALATKPDG
ncbi:uncharacterized protein J7T54_008483 [Emericellopsis cladophorae]|uniref:Uncharacterized protein n=1 Tax=Emericellopsis cladophorae TaxID=2686198 RepID=A0A9P9XVP7_9HYPO|nr:uncharacterized protein J7T54_008483 [Emericellopsis cladophorae]KAI6778305.1 hypothetical protein J7T54_008483 [Emericellopsis cladophorae]